MVMSDFQKKERWQVELGFAFGWTKENLVAPGGCGSSSFK